MVVKEIEMSFRNWGSGVIDLGASNNLWLSHFFKLSSSDTSFFMEGLLFAQNQQPREKFLSQNLMMSVSFPYNNPLTKFHPFFQRAVMS